MLFGDSKSGKQRFWPDCPDGQADLFICCLRIIVGPSGRLGVEIVRIKGSWQTFKEVNAAKIAFIPSKKGPTLNRKHLLPSEKRVILKRKNLLPPSGSKFFLFILIPFPKGTCRAGTGKQTGFHKSCPPCNTWRIIYRVYPVPYLPFCRTFVSAFLTGWSRKTCWLGNLIRSIYSIYSKANTIFIRNSRTP